MEPGVVMPMKATLVFPYSFMTYFGISLKISSFFPVYVILHTVRSKSVEIIADPEMTIYKALDIPIAKDKTELRGEGEEYERYLAKGAATKAAGYTHGDYEGDELQLPAQFIIDREGTVLLANYARSMGGMYTVDELLEKL